MPKSSVLTLVDALVERSPSVAAQLVQSKGIVSRSEGKSHLNALVDGLNPGQRLQLSELLQAEREASLFDALVALHEQAVGAGWEIHAGDQVLSMEPNGYTLAEEFVDRLAKR